ncbi:hypothetical protein BC628DRAFT_1400914 [Trametes gibbosa]|nr:hypothetical protein BC628DRAFT_1400914 [Trametes gibbosa]
MSTASHTPALTPSRSPTPELPLQPDHFYGNEDIRLPPSPNSDGRTWLDPADDPLAQRGIPVFKPTMEEFTDFEGYMNRVEPWGMRSGIVKIIPPQEWTDALPSVVPQLDGVKLKNPIEQHMLGQGGLFQQQNIEKRRLMSVREWAEMCATEDLRAPGVDEVGLHARAANGGARTRPRRGKKQRASETVEPEQREGLAVVIKREEEEIDEETAAKALISPPNSNRTLSPAEQVEEAPRPEAQTLSAESAKGRHPLAEEEEEDEDEDAKHAEGGQDEEEVKPKARGRRSGQTREAREAMIAERAAKDRQFLETFDPRTAWLPPKTTSSSYTAEFCKELERRYWRNCGFGKPAWYGADMQGSLFTDDTTAWNVACLPSALTRLLPASNKGLPGVNTPYLYFGMWRATFAWHVEDMDLFSINYIHFGAPKFWYAIPQGRANALEQTMRSLFPGAGKNCSQFLRHKSYLASPNVLSKSSCRPNYLVQRAGEFVITFPRGYHAGFNLGLNCAESVNFALESWLEIGKKAKACGCVNFSVRIDVDQLLQDRAAENREVYRKAKKPLSIKSEAAAEKASKPKPPSRKRKADGENPPKAKKQKLKPASASEHPVASSSKHPQPSASKTIRVTLKLPPKPKEPDTFPCCLCVSMSQEGLLLVQDPPAWWYEPGIPEAAGGRSCMAHAECANIVPETWVDEVEVGDPDEHGERQREKRVFGVDGIVKDRWNLKCTACTRTRHRVHGAPIQCTKGKCPKAFHVSCAREGHANGIVFTVLREVEKEVVWLESQPPAPSHTPAPTCAAPSEGISASFDPSVAEHSMDVDIDPILLGPVTTTTSEPVQGVAQHQPSPSPQVLKTIKKTEVEVLCHQHNPAILAAKKAQQQDRIRNQLLALPPMSRIKLRVTAGVFEVALCRVLEESHAVEVLWDRGLKREFKWRSVVFGDTEAVVGQKPMEPAPPEHERATPRMSYPPAGSAPPPSYQPTSREQSHSNSPMPPPASAVPTPTYVSPTPTASSSSQQVATTYRAPPSTSYPSQVPYQPRTSTYQYAPGSWTCQYSGATYSTHQYGAPPAQVSTSHYPPTAYQSPSYALPPVAPPSYAHGPYPLTNPSAYPYSYAHPSYGSYQRYGAYGYPPPPQAAAPVPVPASAAQPSQTPAPVPAHAPALPPSSTPTPMPTSAPASAIVPVPPPASTQASAAQATHRANTRGLQWQKPYTGPRETGQKGPPLTVPNLSLVSAPPPALAQTEGGSRSSSAPQASGTPENAGSAPPDSES